MVEIEIPGAPVPWMRTRGNGKRRFKDPRLRDYQELVALLGRSAMAGEKPFREPVQVQIAVGLPVPLSWPDWKKKMALEGTLMPTVKPDLDNLIKGILDALTGEVWADDAVIVSLTSRKRYRELPRVQVIVIPSDQVPAQCTSYRRALQNAH